MRLSWTGIWRNIRCGRLSVTWLPGSRFWALRLDGKIISKHDSRAAAKRKAAKLARDLVE